MAPQSDTTSAAPPADARDLTVAGARVPHRLALSLADERVWTSLTYAGVAVGVGLRLLRWIDNPGIWMDEAFLAINLVDKPLEDIFGPLQFLQNAPPGFLLVEKGAEVALGDADRWLRLFPLLASLASVLLLAYAARRLLAPPAAALAVVLFATSEPLLLRSAEIKHYSTDVAVTTLLLAAYVWAVEAPSERRTRNLVVLGLVSLGGLWLSFPSVFVVAAVVVALAVRAFETRSRSYLGAAAVIGVACLVSFAAVYTVATSNISKVSRSIFGGSDDVVAVGRLKTIENAWWMFINPGGFDNETNSIAALLALFGLYALVRRGTLDRLALLAVPLALAGLADALGRYPLGGRFSTFLVPVLILLAARGAEAVVSWSRRPAIVGTGLAAFLVASPVAIATYHTIEIPARADVKPLLQHLVREWKDGDSLYVYPDSQYQLRYYSTCEDCSISPASFPWPTRTAPPGQPEEQYAPALESVPPTVVIGSRDDPDAPLADLERLAPRARVWMLISSAPLVREGLDDEALLLRMLGRERKLLDEIEARGARLYLFDRAVP